MRVVVVGATGNVGSSLVEALSDDPAVGEVVAIARRPAATPTTASAGGSAKVRGVALDVASADLAPHLAGAHAVVHLAWLFQPTRRPLVTWRANVEGSIRVFDAVARAGTPVLVYASSVGAYSPYSPTRETVDESWPTNGMPTAAYGREKAYVERVLDTFEARHPATRVVRFRPGFIFKREAATAQRRLFLGPFFPGRMARPGRLPVLPLPAGLRFQALHTEDAAEAYRLALHRPVRGPFNLAAKPVLDGPAIAEVVGSRLLRVPHRLVRSAVAAGWHSRVLPADPRLLDLVLGIPLLDTTRVRQELGWTPRWSAAEALGQLLEGMADGAGGPTPPLLADSARRRAREVLTGVGARS